MENKLRPYKCENCGNETEQETNHHNEFVWVCKVCSDKPEEGKAFSPMGLFDVKCLRLMIPIKDEV